jgi:hypothetical protein
MDWNLLYNKHIEKCKNKPILEGKIYHKHHIIPRSSGGGDSENNLVTLEYKDHVIAHYILYKSNPTNSNWIAYRLMSGISAEKKKLVEELKLKGIANRELGLIGSPEAIKKMNKSRAETIAKMTPEERSQKFGNHKENHPFWGKERKGKKAANYGKSKGEYIVLSPEGDKLYFKSLRKMMEYGFDEGTIKRNRNKGKIQKPKKGGRPSKWIGYEIKYQQNINYG